MPARIARAFALVTMGVFLLNADVADGDVIRRVSDIAPGNYSSWPDDYFQFRGDVYFRASGHLGRELYRIRNGLAELVADISPGLRDSYPGEFVEFQNQLFFRVNQSGQYDDFELWKFDGSIARQAEAMNTGSIPNYVGGLTVYRDKMYFRARDLEHGIEFWQFDGNTASLLADLDPSLVIGGAGSWPGNLHVYQDTLYFQAFTPTDGYEPRRFDGRNISRVADVNRGPASSTYFTEEFQFTEFKGALYFIAEDITSGFELRRYSGGSLRRAFEIIAGPNSAGASEATVMGDKMYFVADDGIHGSELWAYDGDKAALVADINPGPDGSGPHSLTVFNGKLYFAAVDQLVTGPQGPIAGGLGYELWSFDGTTAELVADIAAGETSSQPSSLYATDNALYFTAGDTFGSEVWRLVELDGDYSGDGQVDARDLEVWHAAFGTTNLAADGNGDGVVDAADYSVWRDNLGKSVAGGGAVNLAVPEPGAAPIACALVGAIGIMVRGRWRSDVTC